MQAQGQAQGQAQMQVHVHVHNSSYFTAKLALMQAHATAQGSKIFLSHLLVLVKVCFHLAIVNFILWFVLTLVLPSLMKRGL